MAAQQAFVVASGGFWTVKVSGRMVTDTFWTQVQAIDAGRKWLQANGGGELVVHDEQGRIRQKDTIYPGNDPRNIRG